MRQGEIEMKLRSLALSALVAFVAASAVVPTVANAVPDHRGHKVKECHWDRHHHQRVCHWVYRR
jgi:hypothetical protein